MIRAKKSLGQHFLRSKSALEAIRDASDVTGNDLVLEVGPGKGALTEILLHFAAKVIAVEKDEELCKYLEEKFPNDIKNGRLDIIRGDILDFDPEIFRFYINKGIDYKIVANIPYYITGIFLRKFLTAKLQPGSMTILIQKEVAERIVARDKKESLLSISIKAYGKPKYVKTVKAESFSPPPKVDSAIILIEDISRKFFYDNEIDERKFFELVRAGFAHKRKMLLGNLKSLFEKKKKDRISLKEEFRLCGISEKARAEDLTLQDWRCLSLQLEKE